MDGDSLRVEEAVHELVEIFKTNIDTVGGSMFASKETKTSDDKKEGKREGRSGTERAGESSRDKTPKPQDEKTLEEEIDELIVFFNHRTFEALLRAIRNALDSIKRRVFTTRYALWFKFDQLVCDSCYDRLQGPVAHTQVTSNPGLKFQSMFLLSHLKRLLWAWIIGPRILFHCKI